MWDRRQIFVLCVTFGLFGFGLFLAFLSGGNYACEGGYMIKMRCVEPEIVKVIQCYEDDTMYKYDGVNITGYNNK